MSVFIGTGGSEPAGEYWDFDDVYAQPVQNQTSNGQQVTSVPSSGGTDYSALRALSTLDASSAYYGRTLLQLNGPDGSQFSVGTASGEFCQMQIRDASTNNYIQIVNAPSLGGPVIALKKAGVGYNGQTLTFRDQAGVLHQVVGGLIVS